MAGPSLDTPTPTPTTIKFLCSYGGKILPRYPDAKLRYHGGETRVLSVHRSISFAELLLKLGEMCGAKVSLRCQLPTEDLDALVSITSDEDLSHLIEEYDRVASPPSLKIRAFLSLPRKIPSSTSSPSSPSSPSSSASSSSPKSMTTTTGPSSSVNNHCHRQLPASSPVTFPLCLEKSAAKHIIAHHPHPHHHHGYYANGNPTHIYLIHNGNYYQ